VGFSFLKVIAVGVMYGMAMGPAVVRHKENAMESKPHDPFDPTIGVKGVMAALMGNDPAAHRNGAGNSSIEQPQRCGCGRKWDERSNANCQGRKSD